MIDVFILVRHFLVLVIRRLSLTVSSDGCIIGFVRRWGLLVGSVDVDSKTVHRRGRAELTTTASP